MDGVKTARAMRPSALFRFDDCDNNTDDLIPTLIGPFGRCLVKTLEHTYGDGILRNGPVPPLTKNRGRAPIKRRRRRPVSNVRERPWPVRERRTVHRSS